MESINKIFNEVNLIGGVAVTILTYIFGEHWILFAGFLFLNAVDYITGTYKAHKNGESSSEVGAEGIKKKVMYWLIILLAFMVAVIFQEIGITIGVDLSFAFGLGWLTLATYLINELRSILENLIESGLYVSPFLVKGLKLAQDVMKSKEGEIKEDEAKENTEGES